jgi:hypothetical protein
LAIRFSKAITPALLALPLALGLVGAAGAQDFDAVMAAPDDVELNIAYARAEASQGNLSAAASAMERVLILEPNRHADRLFYAVLLFRLGDYDGARVEPLAAAAGRGRSLSRTGQGPDGG